MVLYALILSLVGWALFRFAGFWLRDPFPSLVRYARIYARAAILWGPLQLGWFYGLGQNHSGYVADTSKPPISSRWSDGVGYVRGVDSVLVHTYPEKLIYTPNYHYGVGYKFSLGNPMAKFLYDLFGGWRVTYVMSFVDVVLVGTLCCALVRSGWW